MHIHQSVSNHSGWSQKSLRNYLTGFLLCLGLTLISFGLVKYSMVNTATTYFLLTFFAITQLVIQTICFLGFKSDKDGQWNILPFLFTILVIFFIVGGSLWIMHNLSELMMNFS